MLHPTAPRECPGGVCWRTEDTLRPTGAQVSYTGGDPAAGTEEVGGRDRDRTGDPLLAKQVLSQLSYTPTIGSL